MKAQGRKFVEVFYNPATRNWDVSIEKELKRLGLKHGDVTVICRPKNVGPPARTLFRKESIENGKINL